MGAETYDLIFKGELLKRGFWLYVWEITTPEQTRMYYVGRTGDSSSMNAQSPFNRMGQHLGFNVKSNVLRRRLRAKNVDPGGCTFRLVAHGPILEEASTHDEHRSRRDLLAAMEKALAGAMSAAGYNVMNTVACRVEMDVRAFAEVQAAFAPHFGNLRSHSEIKATRPDRKAGAGRAKCLTSSRTTKTQ
jgi:hypothetical protein